jgi:hypothetical protein
MSPKWGRDPPARLRQNWKGVGDPFALATSVKADPVLDFRPILGRVLTWPVSDVAFGDVTRHLDVSKYSAESSHGSREYPRRVDGGSRDAQGLTLVRQISTLDKGTLTGTADDGSTSYFRGSP